MRAGDVEMNPGPGEQAEATYLSTHHPAIFIYSYPYVIHGTVLARFLTS